MGCGDSRSRRHPGSAFRSRTPASIRHHADPLYALTYRSEGSLANAKEPSLIAPGRRAEQQGTRGGRQQGDGILTRPLNRRPRQRTRHADRPDQHLRVLARAARPGSSKVTHDAARSLDRYLRARARHVQARCPQLWLGINNRGR